MWCVHPACAEGAIQIVGGKARLVADNLCDGLGACIGECPQLPSRWRSVRVRILTKSNRRASRTTLSGDTRSGRVRSRRTCLSRRICRAVVRDRQSRVSAAGAPYRPRGWQHFIGALELAGAIDVGSAAGPFLRGANILVCADCVPFAVPDFHSRYINGRVVLVGCPKLDDLEHYRQKLKANPGSGPAGQPDRRAHESTLTAPESPMP